MPRAPYIYVVSCCGEAVAAFTVKHEAARFVDGYEHKDYVSIRRFDDGYDSFVHMTVESLADNRHTNRPDAYDSRRGPRNQRYVTVE